MKTLNEWLNWLEQIRYTPEERSERVQHLDYLRQLIQQLAIKPTCQVITIAGTNGKGSTATLIEAILIAAGYRIGVYSSPHLLDYTERIRINGNKISGQQLCQAFNQLEQVRTRKLNFFDFTTLAALIIFANHALDVLILEVGIGGRLDAVNTIDADMAIITTIDFDHTAMLGTTREEIGLEKAGIFRPHRPAICGDSRCPESVKAYAKQLATPLYCQGIDFDYQHTHHTWQWQNQQGTHLKALPLPQLAISNAAIALMAIHLLALTIPISSAAIITGLRQAHLPGRFQRLQHQPELILDVAHNPESCRLLASHLQNLPPPQGRLLAIVGMMADKNQADSLAPLLPLVDAWYVTELASPRTASLEQLTTALPQALIAGTYSHPEAAWTAAYQHATTDDIILVFGSFYTVAAIYPLIATF